MTTWQSVTATILAISSVYLTTVELRGQTQTTWTNPSGGNWLDASNWDTPDAPSNGSPNEDSQYVAEIDLETGASYDITLLDFIAVNGVRLDSEDARLQIEGGIRLGSTGRVDVLDGDLVLSGGSIVNGSVNQSGGRILVGRSRSTITNTTLSGDLTFEGLGSFLTVINSQINGNVDLSNGGFLEFANTNQVFEDATIQFGGGIALKFLFVLRQRTQYFSIEQRY